MITSRVGGFVRSRLYLGIGAAGAAMAALSGCATVVGGGSGNDAGGGGRLTGGASSVSSSASSGGGGSTAPPTLSFKKARQVSGLAVDSEHVYWSEGTAADYEHGAVLNARLDGEGAEPTTLVAHQEYTADLLLRHGTLYWIEMGSSDADESSSVLSCPATGCAGKPASLATGNDYAWLAANDTDLYWRATDGTLIRCALSGCPSGPTPVAMPVQDLVWSFAVDASRVAWADTGGVHACDLDDCEGTVVELRSAPTSPTNVLEVAIVGDDVYWLSREDATPASNVVRRCAIGGCADAAEVVPNATSVASFTTDGSLFAFSRFEGSVSDPARSIFACVLPNCTDLRTIAPGQRAITAVFADVWNSIRLVDPMALDAGFIYWASNARIVRQAR